MTGWPQPSEENDYLAPHIDLLLRSFAHWTDGPLLESQHQADAARYLFHAPFVLVSHNAASDPVFTYGNRTALELFEMSWDEFTALPSRQSAEPLHQAERERVLAIVARQGYIKGYQGIRIAKRGRRVLMWDAIVCNLIDENERYCGQAACYKDWSYLE